MTTMTSWSMPIGKEKYMCNNCIHKIVCSKYIACGEVKTCEHFKEERKGRWVDGNCSVCGGAIPTDNRYDFIDESDCVYCLYCGADMRGTEDG